MLDKKTASSHGTHCEVKPTCEVKSTTNERQVPPACTKRAALAYYYSPENLP